MPTLTSRLAPLRLLPASLALWTACAWSAGAGGLFDLGERYFESFDEFSLLNDEIVMDIQQDASGFIWLATQRGLIRFDGYEFRPYRFDESDPSSISGNYVRAMYFDDQKIWVGTYSDGVSIYDARTDAFDRLRHDPNDADSLQGDDIRAIVGNAQHVLIASRVGVNRFDLAAERLTRLGEVVGCAELLGEGKLASLALNEDVLLIGSANGLCRIDVRKQSLAAPQLQGEVVPAMAQKGLFNIDLLPGREAWLSTTDNGIAVLSLDSGAVRWIDVDPQDPGKLHHPWADDTTLVQGEVWVATAGAGIAVIDPATLRVKEHIKYQLVNTSGLSLNDVSAVFVDDAGLVWIGTWGGGMNRFNPQNRAFKVLKHDPVDATSLADSDIRSAKEMSNGDVWLGTQASGIQVVDPTAGLVRTYPPDNGTSGALQDGYIFAFEQFADGEIWVASNRTGVYRFEQANDSFTQFTTDDGLTDNRVRTLFVGDQQTLWLGTDVGLTRLDRASGVFSAVDLQGAPPRTFDKVVETIQSFNGDLWIGTNSGLFVVPAGAQHLVEVTSDPSRPLADNFISDLLVDSRNRLWLATAQGLNILDAWDGSAASFISVNERLGLPQHGLGDSLEEDSQGRIWAQANLIDPSSWSYTRIPRNVGWDVGNLWIGSNGRLRDGTLLFGGTRGLLMIKPGSYQARRYEPNLVVTHSQVDGSRVPMAQLDPLGLMPTSRGFFVEFAALDFAGAGNYQYQYQLIGYDPDWVSTDARNRRASYARLPPGDYVLRARAIDGSGNTSKNELAIPVRQLPAWYQRFWFIALALLAASGVLYLLYKWRVRNLKRQKWALDRLVAQRTENIRQLAQAGQDIAASLDLDSVLNSVYEHTCRFVDNTIFSLGL
ncbi:MAG: two-component regulator propeller domain-containing protein, partial [Pseudomonadota bacterium]